MLTTDDHVHLSALLAVSGMAARGPIEMHCISPADGIDWDLPLNPRLPCWLTR